MGAKKKKRAVKKRTAKSRGRHSPPSPKKRAPAKPKKKKRPAAKKRAATKSKPGGHRVASTILQAITITVIADGEFAKEEETLLARLASEPFFDQVPDVGAVVRQAVDRCMELGVDGALTRLAKDLPTGPARETAFAACLAAAAADGKITGSEARLLQQLRDAFGISDARARELAGPIAPALG